MTADALPRTRKTFLYPIGYLTMAGVGMTADPSLAQRMLFGSVEYDGPMTRMSGLFILGLAWIVLQTFRHRLAPLYPTIIGVRVLFCAGYIALYFQTSNPFFLSVLGIVGFGTVLSTLAYVRDTRQRS